MAYTGRSCGVPHNLHRVCHYRTGPGVQAASLCSRYLFAVGRNEEAARYSGDPYRSRGGRGLCDLRRAGGLSSIVLTMYTLSISPALTELFY